LIGLVLALHHDATALEPFRASFLIITFTVITFSVMFSFGGINSAAYRQFHRSVPQRLLVSCVGLLLVALLPLMTLVTLPKLFIGVCLFILPMLVMAGVMLLEVGRSETDPVVLLNRLCSVKAVSRHLESLVPKIEARIAETKALELSKVRDMPMHEFDWTLSVPPERDDPLTQLAALGLLTLQNRDAYAFRGVVNRFLELIETVEGVKIPEMAADRYKIRSQLEAQVYGPLERVMLNLQQDKGTVSLARVAIDALAEYVAGKARARRQTEDLTYSALNLMWTLAKHCYASGSRKEAKVLLIVTRQIIQRGVDDPPKAEEGDSDAVKVSVSLFHNGLGNLTNVIKRIGSYSVDNDDAELHYRCSEALGYLGCSAVKHEDLELATECLRAISQLGREVRVKELECFDSHCPVRPEAHAAEHIGWVASWVASLPKERQQPWIDVVEKAAARLSGKATELKVAATADETTSLLKVQPEKNHVEGYMMHVGDREVDYSDFKFLKDLKLYGGKGTLMQGPIVPLSL